MTPNFMAFTMITDAVERHEARAADRRLNRRERRLAQAAAAASAPARPVRARRPVRVRLVHRTRHAH